MGMWHTLGLCFGLTLITGQVQAENAAQKKVDMLDLKLSNGQTVILIDDVPVFGVGGVFSAEAMVDAQGLPLDGVLGPGENEVTLQFWPGESDYGFSPGMTVRFTLHSFAQGEGAFAAGSPYKVSVEIIPAADTSSGFALQADVPGQPLISWSLSETELMALPDGGVEVHLAIDAGVDWPEQRWKQGETLSDDVQTEGQVKALIKPIYVAFAEGTVADSPELAPMLERQAMAQKMTVEQLLRTDYFSFVDKSSGFELQPLNLEESRLVLIGYGHLATLDPQPVQFVNPQTGETGSPFLAFWKDGRGQWQIIH